jgi:hypothetical protein
MALLIAKCDCPENTAAWQHTLFSRVFRDRLEGCATFAKAGETVMERHGDEIHISSEEASSGASPQGVRYVLGISLLLTVMSMSFIWIMGTLIF